MHSKHKDLDSVRQTFDVRLEEYYSDDLMGFSWEAVSKVYLNSIQFYLSSILTIVIVTKFFADIIFIIIG